MWSSTAIFEWANDSLKGEPVDLQPLFCTAPVPPKEFQHSESALNTITCGYSICWNKSGLHEVVLGTIGRKQGASAKGAQYPSTESSLCKKRLLEMFWSLKSVCPTKFLASNISYRTLKDGSQDYHLTSKVFKEQSAFKNWISKPINYEAFSFGCGWGTYLLAIHFNANWKIRGEYECFWMICLHVCTIFHGLCQWSS